MLSRLVIAFLPRSKHLLISWLQSPPGVILEPPKIKSVTISIVFPSICHEVIGPDAMILVFWMLSFQPTFSLSSFTFIKRLFSSSLLFVTSFSSFSSGCWRWTGKPGVLQSMELQRVVPNWATELNRIDEWIYFQAKFISPSKNHI